MSRLKTSATVLLLLGQLLTIHLSGWGQSDSSLQSGTPEKELNSSLPADKPEDQGTVVLHAAVDTKGKVREARVVKTSKLDGSGFLPQEVQKEAIKAVRQWKFEPARKDGRPVTVLVEVTVDFRYRGTTQDAPAKYLRIGGAVTAPRAIYTPAPEYPDEASKAEKIIAKAEGTVVFWVGIGTDGTIKELKLLNSYRGDHRGPMPQELILRAEDAVRSWKFKPALKNGVPVPVQVNVEVNMRLY
jgi:TonB family protein